MINTEKKNEIPIRIGIKRKKGALATHIYFPQSKNENCAPVFLIQHCI